MGHRVQAAIVFTLKKFSVQCPNLHFFLGSEFMPVALFLRGSIYYTVKPTKKYWSIKRINLRVSSFLFKFN